MPNKQTFRQFAPLLSASPPRILIVDDTLVNLRVMVDSLENCNYRLVTAQNGAEALQRAAFVKPDLILLDVMMPEMDGFEVCRRLKKNTETADIPVIFMTALNETEHKITGFNVGGADYITKPMQIDEVIARVGTHLNLRAMQRQLQAQNVQLQNHQLELEQRIMQRTAELSASNRLLCEEIEARSRLDEERLSHLRFFENMDRVNRAMQGSNDLDTMMSNVLDIMLSIFDCDRAYLMYPCDPSADAWRVPMGRNRPEYPGVLALGLVTVPMDEEEAAICRILLDADRPVQFGPGGEYPLPAHATEQFGIKSFLAMAVYPLLDKPWMFGIHQCSYPRVWKPDEEKLLQEIGRRLADGLTSLLSYRDLKESEQKFRTLAENLPDNIARYDRQGRLIYINPLLEQTLGKSAPALLGKALKGGNPGREYDEYQTKVEAVIKTGRNDEMELTIPDKVEGLLYYHIRFVAERGPDDEIVGVLAMGRNFTQKRRLQLELIRREREFRTLAENSPDSIIRYDLDCRRIYVNRAYEIATNAKRTHIVGKTPLDDWRLAVPNADEYTKILQRVMATGKAERVEVQLFDADGSPHYFSMQFVPEYDEYNQVNGVLSFATDITELKTAERRQVEASKQAERQLREFSAHLQSVREKEKSGIAREIHDNLGGTLTALKMDLNWLMDELSEIEQATSLLEHIESMSQLLDNAATVTRQVITELRPPLLDDFGLPAALEWQAEQFHKRTGIQCRVACDESSPYELDKTQTINLFRIFQESLTNVVRHSGASRVDVELQHKDAAVILTISDNGCGLQEERIIAPTSYGMLGMRERTEQLGGRINFYSPPNGGLTITVLLPQPTDNKNKGKS